MQEERNENEQAGTYTVDGLTYRYSYVQAEQEADVEELAFQIAKFTFDDCGDMILAPDENEEREERFQNYVRDTALPLNEKAATWEEEDGTLHEGQSESWDNEVLMMDFCSGTLQSFLHRNPIEASNISDEGLFLLPFDEIKDIFEKTITLQVLTEQKNRLISVDGEVTAAIHPLMHRAWR